MKKLKFFLILVVAASQMAFFDFAVTAPKELNLDNIKRISRACYLIQHEYYDPARIKPRAMMEEGFYELAKEVPEILPKFSGNTLTFQLAAKQVAINLGSVEQFYDILFPVSQAFDIIAENYRGEVKPEDMEYAFISGMLSVLDPHSSMLPPKAYEEFKTQTSGQYGGLGIVIGEKENELTVIAPIEDTPAWRAGIQPDDKILQIGGQSTANMDLSDAVDLMRGSPGTKVTLRMQSKAQEPRDVTLTREVIAIVSVQTKLLAQNGKDVGVIRVKGFQEDTYSDMQKGLEKLAKESKGKMAGLVLDMRNNPGGLLDQAILIADKFLKSGDVVYTQAANEADEDVAVAKKQDGDIDLPMVVLLNEGSASASEIVAGALKNNDRAIVMGQKSFGKGSVQSLFSLRDGSSLKLTVAQYLTPGKISIQAEGISPDIHLYPSVVKAEDFQVREDRDFSESKLDSHLENSKYVRASKPFYDMTYLREQTASEESQYVSKIRAEDDYPLQLAAKLLSETASEKGNALDKKAMLSKFAAILDKESDDQDRKIAQAFKKLDVDWSAGNRNFTPNLSYSYQFLDESGAPVTELAASTKARLRVTLKNAGTEPVHRVMGEVESYNPLIDTKEIVFGRIKPGESVSGEVAVTIPTEIINFKEIATFNIYSNETGETPVKESLTTLFTEKLPPQLAYSYTLSDGGKSGTKGNSNGVPEKGETVAFDVTVKNLGPGPAEKTEVNLQNTLGDHVFLHKARATVGKLVSGETAKAELRFDVRDSFDKDEFTIKFFAMDNETKASIADTLKFPQKPKDAAVTPVPGELQVVPRIDVSENSVQKQDRYKVVASIANETPLKDIAIFVKGKKVYYDNLQAADPVRAKTIDVEVPLEDGLNAIVIQARGDRDLISQKNLSVVYKDPEKLAQAK